MEEKRRRRIKHKELNENKNKRMNFKKIIIINNILLLYIIILSFSLTNEEGIRKLSMISKIHILINIAGSSSSNFIFRQ